MAKHISAKWRLTIRVLPFLILVVLGKVAAHYFELEWFSLSPLYGAFVSANVFLIGFLISGVLVDYKESERLPGDLACSLETIVDECEIIYLNNKSAAALDLTAHANCLLSSVIAWFYKEERTGIVLKKITEFNPHFLALERYTQAAFVSRLKIEQNNIRRMIVRAHTIRETDFNPSGYAVAEMISFVLTVSLVFTRIEPYYESIFFVVFVAFVQLYMVFLIHDLDNPFGYYSAEHVVENVSLKPLFDLQKRIKTPEALNGSEESVAVPNPPAGAEALEAPAAPAPVPVAIPAPVPAPDPVNEPAPPQPQPASPASVPSTGSNPMRKNAKNRRRR